MASRTRILFCTILCIFLQASTTFSQECGVVIDNGDNKIVGGEEVGSYTYPWFALLVYKGTTQNACGGSLITTTHVLTAGHCFKAVREPPYEDLYVVWMGVLDRCNEDPTKEVFNVAKVMIHENYDTSTGSFYNDIAIMVLDREATNFYTVCLPPPESYDVGGPALAIGFGDTKENGTSPCIMMRVDIQKFTREECNEFDISQADKDNEGAFCAGVAEGGKDTCQGDSGGPLVTLNSDGYYQVAGIVSSGVGCARPRNPGFYTNVAYFLDWIQKNTN